MTCKLNAVSGCLSPLRGVGDNLTAVQLVVLQLSLSYVCVYTMCF